MRKILLALLSVTLIAAIAFGADSRREAKEREAAKELSAIRLASLQQRSISPYWDTLSIPSDGIIQHTVNALPGGVIWVAGTYENDPTITMTYRSTDNGATWKTDTLKAVGTDGAIFAAKNANVALAASFSGKIFRTTNGGTSWDSVWNYNGGYFDGMAFKGNSDSVFAFGDADASGLCVVRSLDAGLTWTRMTNLPAEEQTASKWWAIASYRQSIDIVGNLVIMATYYDGGGLAPRILRSTDFGGTWTSQGVTLTGGIGNATFIRSLTMTDQNVGWLFPMQTASGVRYYAHKTTDGGLTWGDTILTVRGMTLKGLRQLPGSKMVLATGYVGNFPKAALSKDGGATFMAINPDTLSDGSDLGMISWLDQNTAFSSGYYRAMKFKVSQVTFQAKMNIKMREGGFQPGSGDVVQVKGSFNDWGGNDLLADGDGDSTYSVTVPMAPGDINYKFFKTLRAGGDWESDPNRSFTVGAGSVTIPAVYFDRDSIYTPPVPQGVTFRVNMKIKMLEQTFLPGSGDIVRVAGSFNDWGNSTDTLTDADHDSIFTKTISLNENQAIQYKFLKTTRSGDWESMADNRQYTVPVGGGLVPIAFFDNDTVFNAPVTVNFLWQVKMSAYQTLGWFRPDLKDSIEVRGGFNGWAGTKLLPVTGQPGSYEAAIIYNGTIGDALQFKYFMSLDSAGATARFPGYIHSGTGATRDGFCYDHPAERGDGNRVFNVTAGGNTPVPQVAFSNIDSRGLMLNTTDSCRVTLKVNMGPAKRYIDAFVPATDTVRLVWQDILWRSAQRMARGGASAQFPDITMTPAAGGGDSIYQATFTVKGKTHYNMQYTYRYIHAGGNAVDQGGGLGGQNPYITRFIQPLAANSWPATYTAPTDLWMKDSPLTGEIPPFTTAVDPGTGAEIPMEFALGQNYPNPFNPTTSISYAIPVQANVTLKVFNIVGQEVATLLNNEVQNRGSHIVTFDARSLATGVYFYRLEAGKFNEVKKMLLLK
jgi:hypothetical protein